LYFGHSVPQIRTNFISVILRESLYQPKALVTGEPASGERLRGRNTETLNFNKRKVIELYVICIPPPASAGPPPFRQGRQIVQHFSLYVDGNYI